MLIYKMIKEGVQTTVLGLDKKVLRDLRLGKAVVVDIGGTENPGTPLVLFYGGNDEALQAKIESVGKGNNKGKLNGKV